MRLQFLFAAGLAVVVSACSAAGTNQNVPPTNAGLGAGAFSNDQLQPDAVDMTSVLKLLTKQVVVGSTVDPTNGDQNPYGLLYVNHKPLGKGLLKLGDLVVCNFNDKANTQGAGTTLEVLSSTPGSKPVRFAQNSNLKGCAALVINGYYSTVFAADSGAKNVAAVADKGKVVKTYTNKMLAEPWSTAYWTGYGYPPGDAIFTADASTGKIVRINLGAQGSGPSYVPVVTGFAVNHGKPGSILGPSGLQFNYKTQTLYAVDGVSNTVVAFSHAYNTLLQANSIVVSADGKSFTGPGAKYAHLVYAGGKLNGPISLTVLPNGNLVIGNTLNPKGTNLLVEITSTGKLLATKNVDKGPAGALFGIVSSGSTDATTKIYFNDDNKNNVQVLEKP